MDSAIALLEVASIAQGMYLCDVVVKKSPVRFLRTEPVSPGKYLLMFCGDVASVQEAYDEALALADGEIVDMLFLPYVHEQILPALDGETQARGIDAVGIFECHTVASAIVAADQAVKSADVALIEFRTAKGIGGKAFFTLTGAHTEVEAALEAAVAACEANGTCVRSVLIPNPHEDFFPVVLPKGAAARLMV